MAKDLAKYQRRRLMSIFVMGLCWAASAVGIAVLLVILGTLIYRGAGGLSLHVFTDDVPPPGAAAAA